MMIKLFFRNILVIACLGIFSIASAEMRYKGVIYPKDASNGYFMYYTTAGGLVDSPLSSDGTDITNSGNMTQADAKYIATDEIRARDAGGLKLYDDGGTKGIFVADNGNVGIGTLNPLESLHVVTNTAGQGIRFERTSATSGRYTFGLTSGGDFQIDETGVASRLHIAKTTGNVGIGTTEPDGKLDISADVSNYWLRLDDASNNEKAYFYNYTGSAGFSMRNSAGTNNVRIMTSGDSWLNGGNVGIGTLSPSEKLHVAGNIRNSALAGTGNRAVYSDANGNLTNSSSDRTLKTNITPITYGLTQTNAMQPISFNWRDPSSLGSQKEIGFIAQEMEELVPEVVGMNSDGTKSLDYPKLTAVLCKAIQELSSQVAALTIRIENLEGGE